MPGGRVAIIGAGAWGTTLAIVAARAGNEVRLWFRDAGEASRVAERRENARRLPGVPIPEAVRPSGDLTESLARADLVVLAVPSQAMGDAARRVAPLLSDTVVLSATKGLEVGTLRRMTEVVEDAFARAGGAAAGVPVAALSGPNLAGEIARGKPAGSVIACRDAGAARRARELLMSGSFRCYTNEDVVGVEMCGALKNIIAIGAGIGAGMDAGDNALAAFVSRGIAEIARLGVAAGAHPLTFAGLAGLGDLIATCSSRLSRNHAVGRGLAAGRPLDDILADLGHVAEGVTTTRAARELADRLAVEMPITEQMYHVLFEGYPPLAAITDLMSREPRDELDGLRQVLPGTS